MPARDDVRRMIEQEYGLSDDPLENELGLAADPAARQQQLFAGGGALMTELTKRRQEQTQRENEQSTTAMFDPNYWPGMARHLQERPDIAGAEMVSGMTGERTGPLGGKSDIQRDLASVFQGMETNIPGSDSPEEVEDYFKSREMTSRYDENLPPGMRAQLETAGTIGDVGLGVGAGVAGSVRKGATTKLGRLSPRKRRTVGDLVGTKPNKTMKDLVRKQIRQEMADPTSGKPIGDTVKVPDKLVQQRIREARLRQAMLSGRVEAGLSSRPFMATIQDEPLKGGAFFRKGADETEIGVSRANMQKMSEAAQREQIGHEVGHGAAHGLEDQAPATQAWREAEQDMIESIHAEKTLRKHGGKPTDIRPGGGLDEYMDYHGRLEQDMKDEIEGAAALGWKEGGYTASQEAGTQLKALHEADLRQIYRPHSAESQLRHGPDEGLADLFQMMSENPEKLTPGVRQLLIDAGFKL